MSKIPRPYVQLPPAPKVYDQREEQEFRRLVEIALRDPIEDTIRPSAQASFAIGVQTADDTLDRYYYSWTVSGHPVGTTYNVIYEYTNTAETLEESGVVTSATSGGYIQSTGNVGASPTYVVTVNALNAGQIIATASRTGIFVT